MATLNFKIGKPFQLTAADIKDLKKSKKTYEAFNKNQEELNQMNFGKKNVSDVTVDDTTKLSELLKNAKSGEHIGMKINGVCFDLNIFNQLYFFFADHSKPQNEDEKLPGVDLTIGEVKKLISKGGFPKEIMSESKKYTFLLYNRVTAK